MTEGVWAMAPIMLHTQITHRKVRKASWQPGLGHFPGKATASSLLLDIHAQLLRFWQKKEEKKTGNDIQSRYPAAVTWIESSTYASECDGSLDASCAFTHWFGAASKAGGEVGDSVGATDGTHWCCVAVTVTDAHGLRPLPRLQCPREEVKGHVTGREYIWFSQSVCPHCCLDPLLHVLHCC